MTCTHRFDADDVCIDCGYDDGLRYMQPTQHVLRLADLPRPDGEQHDMDPAHDLCLGDDPCICIQLVACEQRMLNLNPVAHDVLIAQRARERALDAAREAIKNTRCPEGYEVKGCSHWDDALAAIDALKEKP